MYFSCIFISFFVFLVCLQFFICLDDLTKIMKRFIYSVRFGEQEYDRMESNKRKDENYSGHLR